MVRFGNKCSTGRTGFGVLRNVSILLVLLLCGCASVAGVPDASGKTGQRIIEKVPFFPQEDYQCGPASLASVLNYWGVSSAPDEIAKAIYSRSARGTLNVDLVMYAQARGLEASQYRGAWDDLRQKIDAGFPLVVLVDYGFWVLQSNHFMVVLGYREDGVIVNSGKDEKKVIRKDDFLKSWGKTNYWTLLVTRKP